MALKLAVEFRMHVGVVNVVRTKVQLVAQSHVKKNV